MNYGKLLTKDIKLHRQYFKEMVSLIGINLIYKYPSSDKHYTTIGELKASHPVVDEDNSGVTLRLGGSTSVQKIAEALSAAFKEIAGCKVSHNYTGSGAAYKATQGSEKDGATGLDIGFASREFKDSEPAAADTFGKICVDAIVAVVNNNNTQISAALASQLMKVYDGTYEKWSDFVYEEPDPQPTFDTSKNIIPYTRDTTSGTRDGFFTGIGFGDAKADNAPLVAGFVEVTDNGDMIAKVKADEYGVGYISLASYADSGLKGLKYEGVEPTEANVLNGSYELTRNFNYVVRNDYAADSKEAKLIKAFVAFMFSVEGKEIINSKDGIIDIKPTDKTWAELKANYETYPKLVGCIFEEHPTQQTLRKMGWISELQENSSLIHIPYDLENIQQGCLFIVPSGIDNTEGRVFRVIKLSNIMVYPASITCEIIPEYVNTFDQSKFKHSNDNFNLLDIEED